MGRHRKAFQPAGGADVRLYPWVSKKTLKGFRLGKRVKLGCILRVTVVKDELLGSRVEGKEQVRTGGGWAPWAKGQEVGLALLT